MMQAERYVMNELYKLERTTLEGYETYNFPKGMFSETPSDWRLICNTVITALTNFANVTLSSLYFDIVKDVLYTHDVLDMERRTVVDTLERVRSGSCQADLELITV